MANPEHLEILRQGVEVWNGWRIKHLKLVPDLSDADLSNTNLHDANLISADLRGTLLLCANLNDADLSGANLDSANLSKAQLRGAYLLAATLISAQLPLADIRGAHLRGADFQDAYLSAAHLDAADLCGANLKHANLRNVYLTDANLSGANLSAAKVYGAKAFGTIFANIDLRQVEELEGISHQGPSEVSISTIYRSEGQIPESFLRGCGVSEDFITYMHSLTAKAIDFYSCFISYSSKDQTFAERLHADLQAKGVRVWFAPHDMRIGSRLRPTIDESIKVYDKLLLVLSEHSVSSQWVEQEVETAFRKERQPGGSIVLFPVRLDDTVLEVGEGWPALIRDTRHVGDFTNWKDHDSYLKAFDRLLRDLKTVA